MTKEKKSFDELLEDVVKDVPKDLKEALYKLAENPETLTKILASLVIQDNFQTIPMKLLGVATTFVCIDTIKSPSSSVIAIPEMLAGGWILGQFAIYMARKMYAQLNKPANLTSNQLIEVLKSTFGIKFIDDILLKTGITSYIENMIAQEKAKQTTSLIKQGYTEECAEHIFDFEVQMALGHFKEGLAIKDQYPDCFKKPVVSESGENIQSGSSNLTLSPTSVVGGDMVDSPQPTPPQPLEPEPEPLQTGVNYLYGIYKYNMQALLKSKGYQGTKDYYHSEFGWSYQQFDEIYNLGKNEGIW